MRSLVPLDSRDLRHLACPWCGRTPPRATLGFKAVRDGVVVGMLAAAPASDGGMDPVDSVVVVQMWVRRQDVGELIGTQLVHRLAAVARDRRVRCVVAPGTRGVPDCGHLPADFLAGLGFTEAVAGTRWRLDLRRTVPVAGLVRAARDAVGRFVRNPRPAPANRG